MARVQNWVVRLSVLTIIVLVVGTFYLGAQGEPAQDGRAPVASSNPTSESRYVDERQVVEIGWNQLLNDLEAELAVDGEAQSKLGIDRVPDGPRKSVLSATSLGKTAELHGLLRLPWDQRKTRRIELFELGNERYLVVKDEEYVEVKAPFGEWYLENEQPMHSVLGSLVGQVITGKLP